MEKPWKVIVAFVGVFIAGSIFGGLLAVRFSNRERALTAQLVQMPPQAIAPVTSPTANATAADTPPTPPTITATAKPAGQPTPAAAQVQPPQWPMPPGMASQTPQIMRRYVERLDLTAEQKERVNPLIQRAASDLRRQQQNNFRETGVIIQHLQEDISKELTPVQRKRLEEMAERQREMLEKRIQEDQKKQQAERERARAQPGQKPAARPAGAVPKDGKTPAKKPVDDGQ
jgi:hypothetical protein